MATCPYCAEEIPGNVSVCPYCNSRLQPGAARNPAPPGRSGGGNGTAIILIILAVLGGGFLVCGGIVLALVFPAMQQAREAALRTESKNNLKQIGLALHNYLDNFSVFPPGSTVDDTGLAHHSWQTQILPYLDQASPYNRIDFNRPWDDPVNASVFMSTVPIYLNPKVPQLIHPSGFGISHYTGNSLVLYENSSLSYADLPDGFSNTIMAGEVAEGFKAWGDPTNVRDPSLGINISPDGFGSPFPGGAHVLMMDGSVRFISESISLDTLKSLSTPNGGEVVTEF